ncbi:MAG: tyrosine-type recombinase/integrase [Dechloromonas sp.]|nr:tyrosine-type recombinase/integrase [Dechloromonas sp.]
MTYRTIGNTVAEWDENAPLRFTMCEEVGPRDGRYIQRIAIDLTDLKGGFSESFLIHLKEHLMDRRHQISLKSIEGIARVLKIIFAKTIVLKLFDTPVTIIDEGFLLSLAGAKEHFAARYLKYFKIQFTTNPHSPLFAKGLIESDFPIHKNKKGSHGSLIDSILAKALSRAAIAHILDICDTAYAMGTMDIGHYSFVHLAFAVFVRPNSYRQIRLGDFTFDDKKNQYFVWIVTTKTGEAFPSKVFFRINEPLGVLLTKQRQHVIDTYGHLIDKNDIGKLALFPSRQLKNSNLQWRSDYANQNFGMIENGSQFVLSYAKQIKRKHLDGAKLSMGANALRHTVGTLLAQTGASAKTIQAVLKHASDFVCRAYVDIAFHSMIDELSEAMKPAFTDHLPELLKFRSKADPILAKKLIRSEDVETGQIEETGECGKAIACADAPISCYGCFRFRPCWDADHSINLKIVEREIGDMSQRGKPFQSTLDRARVAKQHILIVMNAADRFRDAMQFGEYT